MVNYFFPEISYKMSYSVYKTSFNALRKFMISEREESGPLPAGGEIMSATTICVGADESIDIIPLHIQSYPVNLKKMWFAMNNPVAILFREWVYDWVALVPRDTTFREWNLIRMPWRDHDMHRAQALAELVIRSDFGIEDAKVFEIPRPTAE